MVTIKEGCSRQTTERLFAVKRKAADAGQDSNQSEETDSE